MSRSKQLRVVLVKPSKYNSDGFVERFRWGSMPNTSLPYLRSLTPAAIAGAEIRVHAVDEYVETDLAYLDLLDSEPGRTLVALVGVQSHQLHRALDLASLAVDRGSMAVLGGPHPMTCDTSDLQDRGVSFAISEAELVWPRILDDAVRHGELDSLYGGDRRWQAELEPPALVPPSRQDLKRYASRMLGIYPARGCPYRCNFCSIVKIAGHEVRSQPVETTLESLRAARAVGARAVFFASDNFNKYADAVDLLEAMIDEKIRLPFFVQCDVQIYRQPELVDLLGRAGCFNMFLGVESFDREILKAANKFQNHPGRYRDIVRLCRGHGIFWVKTPVPGTLHDGFTQGVLGVLLGHRRQTQHLRLVSHLGNHIGYRWFTFGQGTRLIKDNHLQLGSCLNRISTLEQDAIFCPFARPGHNGARGG